MLIGSLIFVSTLNNVSAFNIKNSNVSTEVVKRNIIDNKTESLLTKLSKVYEYFVLDSKGQLKLYLTDSELKQNFNFDDDFIYKIKNIIENANISLSKNKENKIIESISSIEISPMLHYRDWSLYFTLEDLHKGLFAAAQVGPAAVMAALSAIGSTVPGAGTAAGDIIGLFGGGTICYYVIQAVANGKGLRIGIQFNGYFPNPIIELW